MKHEYYSYDYDSDSSEPAYQIKEGNHKVNPIYCSRGLEKVIMNH